jgi:hypothetical protein
VRKKATEAVKALEAINSCIAVKVVKVVFRKPIKSSKIWVLPHKDK